MKCEHGGSPSPVADHQHPQKKVRSVRSTVGLENPTPMNFKWLWQEGPFDHECLGTAASLFGRQRSWFVGESYVDLYNAIVNDTRKVHIIRGTSGIGKSAFLMYALARMRSENEPALLHFHRAKIKPAIVIFFPADGITPQVLMRNHPDYYSTFLKWHCAVNKAKSVFLVDDIDSFSNADFPSVTYALAKSSSCDIGWMKASQRRKDHWLSVWDKEELLSYATQVQIPNAEEVIHMGGVARYAFSPNAAKKVADNAAI